MLIIWYMIPLQGTNHWWTLSWIWFDDMFWGSTGCMSRTLGYVFSLALPGHSRCGSPGSWGFVQTCHSAHGNVRRRCSGSQHVGQGFEIYQLKGLDPILHMDVSDLRINYPHSHLRFYPQCQFRWIKFSLWICPICTHTHMDYIIDIKRRLVFKPRLSH